ncbi:hypothetical protein FUAX_04470 [Fulvitalea axinellae]|uniref:Lipoprotein n=1 Tax=Fulvitalea axinellae TaxID=1182444 RepID=A0AAU9CFF2_9BACT|nr:hypothetical protein FUAX_04470 [Fulvitalea axinellae]
MEAKTFRYLWIFVFFFACDNKIDDTSPPQIERIEQQGSDSEQASPEELLPQGPMPSVNAIPVSHYPIDLKKPPRRVKFRNGDEFDVFRYWWDGATSINLPSDIADDIDKEDGWEVLFNTIREYDHTTGTGITQEPLVILYNRYRGILRCFYFYIDEANIGNDLVAVMSLGPEAPSWFNQPHKGQSSPINESPRRKQIYSFPWPTNIKTHVGLTKHTWYAFEFDVSCYDSKTVDNFTFAIQPIQRVNRQIAGRIKQNASYTDGAKKFGVALPSKRSLGVFNLPVKPMVYGEEQIVPKASLLRTAETFSGRSFVEKYCYTQKYELSSDIAINYNPDVLEQADVSAVFELVYVHQNKDFDIEASGDKGMDEYNNILSLLGYLVGVDVSSIKLSEGSEVWGIKSFQLIADTDFQGLYGIEEKSWKGQREFMLLKPSNAVFAKVRVKISPKNGRAPIFLQRIFPVQIEENNTRNPVPYGWGKQGSK